MALRILVVENHDGLRDALQTVLEVVGLDVSTAVSVADALAQIRRRRPHVVLVETRLPDVPGWRLPATLRARGINLPVVFTSFDGDLRRLAEEHGAAVFIAKPFQPEELLDILVRFAPAAAA